jgi:citrate lyase subunit beta / citryl-CoA lyase
MGVTTTLDFIAPLFVPGNRPERFEKAAGCGADAVIIDLEDAVAAEAKSAARSSLRADFTSLPILVRINGFGTAWHADDLIAASRLPFAAIVIPKSELVPQLLAIASSIDVPLPPLLALIETGRGLADARQIAALPGVSRLAFGSVDFCADIGCAHTPEALLSARSELVLASRLANKPAPLDGITTALEDLVRVSDDSAHARSLGFGGKLCIHPKQVQPVLASFRPGASEIAWAHRVLASGDGVTTIDGMMVDEPVRARARSILQRARR